MQAPDFWQSGKGGASAVVLSPLGWLYGLATKAKLMMIKAWVSPVPIICVGNLITGGAGKTPVALDLAKRLQAKGRNVHFLSRGYGGHEKGPLRVDPKNHGFARVGDEPLLLAAHAPTWVSHERRAGCLAAAKAGADIIIMDDGFQNPYVAKDFSIIVIDGGYGFGNAKLIPAGPLRETIASGLARAQAVVVIGEDRTGCMDLVSRHGHSPLCARLDTESFPEDISGKPVVAFTGIGRPDKFFETVSGLGCIIEAQISFADHHPFSRADIKHLHDTANKANARLLSTEKDAQRLPPSFLDEVTIISVTLEWQNEKVIDTLLDGINHV
jgi:tetraacyldisaccharide 4'-kinase